MIQIKSWVKAHKNEIVTSVIVSIVTAIIIKFGEIFLFLAPKAGNSIWRVFRDSIYYQAGRFSVTTCITFLISCLSAIVFGLILSLVMSTVKALNQYELLNRIEQIIERKEADPSIELSTDENKLIDKYREANKSNIPSAKKIKKNLVPLVLVGILLIIWIWTSIILPASLHQGFERCRCHYFVPG